MEAARNSSIYRSLGRQVHIVMYPPPRNLAESKLVLKSLQKFGEVSAFHYSKYNILPKWIEFHGAKAWAIFENEHAAAEALRKARIRIPIPAREDHTPPQLKVAIARQASEKLHAETERPLSKPSSGSQETMSIKCNIHPIINDRALNPARNLYYNGFEVSEDSFEVEDLTRKPPPSGVPLRQYADCFAGRIDRPAYSRQQRILKTNSEFGANSLTWLYMNGPAEESEKRKLRLLGNFADEFAHEKTEE